MPGFITALGQQLATDAAGKALGIAFSPIENAIQYKQQEKLQGLQIKGSKELTDYNTAKQMEMWRNTNYSSQRAEMIKAGLNPALMYGMGGGGGTTANISQGSVSGSQASQKYGQEGMGLTTAATIAQIELMKSEAKKNEAEATKISGVDTALGQTQIASLTQGINNQKAVERLTQIEQEIKQVQASVSRQTINDQMRAIENVASKGSAEIAQLQLSNQLDLSQMNDKIKLLRQNVVNAGIEAAFKEAQVNKTYAVLS